MSDRPRKVLLLSYAYPPAGGSGVIRAAALASRLPEAGWETTVLCSYDVTFYADRSWLGTPALSRRILRVPGPLPPQKPWRSGHEGVRSLTGWTPGPRRALPMIKSFLRFHLGIPDRALLWVPAAVRAGLREITRSRPDAILATGGPWSTLVLGALLSRRSGVPLVADFRDTWAAGAFGRPTGPLKRCVDRVLERFVVSRAGAVTVILPSLEEDLRGRHGSRMPESVHVIPNGFEPLPPAGPRPENSPYTVLYTGSLAFTEDPVPFLKALARVRAGREIVFRQVGVSGPDIHGKDLREHVETLGLAGICDVEGPMERHEILKLQQDADLLLALGGPIGIPGGGLPNKLLEYAASGTPVLALCPADGVMSRFVAETGIGLAVDPTDQDRVAGALAGLKDGSLARPERNEAALRPYRWDETARRFAAVLESVL
jgi:glycosyltransferase involved in cell wall biosynthesis